jgi:hypothetical protein
MGVGDVRAFIAEKGCRQIDNAPLDFGRHLFQSALSALEQKQLMDLCHGSSSARGAALNDPQRNVDS